MKTLLNDFPVVTPIKVRWSEMDAAMHVNNVLYFQWAETARFDYFEKLNFPVVPDDKSTGLILGWQECKYILPVVYPDKVFIGTSTRSFEKDRFIMESHFYSEAHQKLVAISRHRIVCYNYTQKEKVEVPEALKAAILAFEKRTDI